MKNQIYYLSLFTLIIILCNFSCTQENEYDITIDDDISELSSDEIKSLYTETGLIQRSYEEAITELDEFLRDINPD